jgi:hypothetical protein
MVALQNQPTSSSATLQATNYPRNGKTRSNTRAEQRSTDEIQCNRYDKRHIRGDIERSWSHWCCITDVAFRRQICASNTVIGLTMQNARVSILRTGGDRLASAVALGDTNGDGLDDALACVPGEEWGTTITPDTLVALFGTTSGLTSSNDMLFAP